MELTARTRLIIAIVCGLLAAVFTLMYVGSAEERARAAGLTGLEVGEHGAVEVVVVKRPLAPGEAITEEDVGTRVVPGDWAIEDAVIDTGSAVGRSVRLALMPNQVLTFPMFSDRSFSAVGEGMSAVSIPTQDVRSVGGRVEPGDVVEAYRYVEGKAQVITSAEVLETSDTGGVRGLSWVTLRVPDEHVPTVLDAAVNSTIYLTLPGGAS